MKEKRTIKAVEMFAYIGMMIWTVSLLTAATYFYRKGIGKVFKMALLATVGAGVLLFTIEVSKIQNLFQYDIREHLGKFYIIYFLCVLISILLPKLPYTGWIFPAMALAMALFANARISMIATSILLFFTVMLSDAPMHVWMLYFTISIVAIFLFEHLDINYKTAGRLWILMSVYAVCLLGLNIFLTRNEVKIEQFLIPIISLFSNFILFSVVLRLYSVCVVHKQKNIYALINDQEYDLIKEFKEDTVVYYNAIHTSYFCEKIARRLNMNVDLAKALGYYHKIAFLKAQKEGKDLHDICIENEFPDEVEALLREYTEKTIPLKTKEATVLLFADTVVSSIMYLLHKEPDAKPDYPKIIEVIFKRKKESGILNHSDISIYELHTMEHIFAGEKLYYDFLR